MCMNEVMYIPSQGIGQMGMLVGPLGVFFVVIITPFVPGPPLQYFGWMETYFLSNSEVSLCGYSLYFLYLVVIGFVITV